MRTLEHAFRIKTGSQDQGERESFPVRDNLFLVVEGFGEGELGETAENLAYKIITEAFFNNLSESNSPGNAIIHALKEANRNIFDERVRREKKMAASVSLIFISDRIMYFTHLGDSRIYFFHKGELSQLTRDHTVREEGRFAGKKHMESFSGHTLTEGLGIHEKTPVMVKKYHLQRNEHILMTTSALTGKVSDREILRVARRTGSPGSFCDGLIDLAAKKGSKGSVSVGVIRFKGVSGRFQRKFLTSAGSFIILGIIIAFLFHFNTKEPVTNNFSDTGAAPEEKVLKYKTPADRSVQGPVGPERIAGTRTVPSGNVTDVLRAVGKAPEDDAKFFKNIKEFIDKWKSAWENTAGEDGDIESYISFYSKSFRSEGFDKEKWKRDKALKGGQKHWIRIDISGLKIEKPKREGSIEVRFKQDFRSSNFLESSMKMLILEKEGADWKIVAEKSY